MDNYIIFVSEHNYYTILEHFLNISQNTEYNYKMSIKRLNKKHKKNYEAKN
jgi:hypothetical protein